MSTFNPTNYVTGKTYCFKSYITNQNLPYTPSIILEVKDLSSMVSLKLVVEMKASYPESIGEIVVVNFNEDDKLGVKKYCESLGVAYYILNINDDITKVSRKISNCINDDTILRKLKKDISRGILYYIANKKKGMVLASINKTDLTIGNFSKTSDKVGDWNLVGDLNSSELQLLATHFNIPSEFVDLQNLFNYEFEVNNLISYSFVNKKDGTLSEKRKFVELVEKSKHKHMFPYNINNAVNVNITKCSSSKDDTTVTMYETLYPLSDELNQMLSSLRSKNRFDVKKWVSEKIMNFVEYLRKTNIDTVVIAVSGGIDSATVLALAVETKKRYPKILKKIVAITIPISSTSSIQNRAYENCDEFGVQCFTVNLTDEHESLCNKISQTLGFERSDFSDGCFKSSMRAPVLYYVSRIYKSCVLGTGNKSEDGYLGYFSKSGDGLVDVQLIADLYKTDVYVLAKELHVIDSILLAHPSADLFDSQTDESELGFSYDFVELYMRLLEESEENQVSLIEGLSEEEKQSFNQMKEKIVKVNTTNKHKFEMAKII